MPTTGLCGRDFRYSTKNFACLSSKIAIPQNVILIKRQGSKKMNNKLEIKETILYDTYQLRIDMNGNPLDY